jgi:hypothetical protein
MIEATNDNGILRVSSMREDFFCHPSFTLAIPLHVRSRKKFPATLVQPAFTSAHLTLRAVAISIGIEGDDAIRSACTQ